MADALETVRDLVARYQHNADLYRRPAYNEAQVRTEFIDPLFVALGWDVHNVKGRSPRYRDVIHEATLRQGGSVKAPDYAFCVGPERKFFVEAKKPAVDIATDPAPAYQLRRYAWTAKLPLSILTNFRQLAVYDCRVRPKAGDDAATARVLSVTYDQYAEQWGEIARIFSRDAVWGGAFDRFAESETRKRGTQTVDDAFLAEIEEWRVLLARNIALRNCGLSLRDLNYAVQQTIDRIIFLRIAEDRGMEPYGQLRDALEGPGVYPRLVRLFQRADDRYNSGLFHFRAEPGRDKPDNLTLNLTIDDKVLGQIIGGLYYPECPYAFDALSADILGSIYERFLGSVVRLTPAGRARVEEKPEVRKAGGVYYTPRYIVDYIVEHTVGALVNEKSPGQIADLRVLDPACGSGSFLLGAFQYLLDWHLEWYTSHPTARPRSQLYQGAGGEWFLTTDEKKRILLDHIYGVDIDPQAVEVTKLSLLLKVLEGENAETLAAQREIWQERALPDLAANIQCGNSLIGPEFYHGQQMALFDEEEFYRINAFDLQAAFPEIMARGGFDAVIGNPPYGFREIHSVDEKRYFKSHYVSSEGSFDNYFLFYEASLRVLRQGGYHGFIAPVTWLTIPSARALRKFILDHYSLRTVCWLPGLVFANAQVNTLVSIIQRSEPSQVQVEVHGTADPNQSPDEERSYQQHDFVENDYYIAIFENPKETELLNKIGIRSTSLSAIARPCSGYNPYERGKGEAPNGGPHTTRTVQEKPYHSDTKLSEEWKPEVVGRDLERYSLTFSGQRWIKYGPWLAAPRDPSNFVGERILVQEITGGPDRRIVATYCDTELYHSRDVIPIKILGHKPHPFFLLGLINSRLMTWYHHKRSPKSQKALFPKLLVSDLRNLPIRTIDWDDDADVARHDRMVALVQQMLDQHRHLAAATTPRDRDMTQRRIDLLDDQIDALVYELYGLTDEEIATITDLS